MLQLIEIIFVCFALPVEIFRRRMHAGIRWLSFIKFFFLWNLAMGSCNRTSASNRKHSNLIESNNFDYKSNDLCSLQPPRKQILFRLAKFPIQMWNMLKTALSRTSGNQFRVQKKRMKRLNDVATWARPLWNLNSIRLKQELWSLRRIFGNELHRSKFEIDPKCEQVHGTHSGGSYEISLRVDFAWKGFTTSTASMILLKFSAGRHPIWEPFPHHSRVAVVHPIAAMMILRRINSFVNNNIWK